LFPADAQFLLALDHFYNLFIFSILPAQRGRSSNTLPPNPRKFADLTCKSLKLFALLQIQFESLGLGGALFVLALVLGCMRINLGINNIFVIVILVIVSAGIITILVINIGLLQGRLLGCKYFVLSLNDLIQIEV
jgi:hypothetical protein